MKCQILFSRKNEKNTIVSSAELAKRVIKVRVACIFNDKKIHVITTMQFTKKLYWLSFCF